MEGPGSPPGKRVVDSDSVNGLDFLPKSVVVAGSGIIAIEMANIFRKLGAEVTMVVRSTGMAALSRIGAPRDSEARSSGAALRRDARL